MYIVRDVCFGANLLSCIPGLQRHPAILFIYQEYAQIPELANVQPIHVLPISEGKCSIQMQFQARLSAIHVSSMLADSIIDNCRDGMVLVWFLAWIFSWWSEQLSLWALRSWKDCVFYPSSAKMFSHWASSSDLRSSGSNPEMSWSILSFQWYKWHQNLVIFSYHYHLC